MKRTILAFAAGLFVGIASLLAVVSANSPEMCCTQVAVNTQRIERMDHDLTSLKEWRIEHTEHATSDIEARLKVVETQSSVHDWILRFLGGAVALTVLAAILRLILKRSGK